MMSESFETDDFTAQTNEELEFYSFAEDTGNASEIQHHNNNTVSHQAAGEHALLNEDGSGVSRSDPTPLVSAPGTNPSDGNKRNQLFTELLREKERLDPVQNPHLYRLIQKEIARVGIAPEAEHSQEVDLFHNTPITLNVKCFPPTHLKPNSNYAGRLIGPKGSYLKALMAETNSRIYVLGRGVIRDQQKEEELRKSQTPNFLHLNEDLHFSVTVTGPAVEAYGRMGYALSCLGRQVQSNSADMLSLPWILRVIQSGNGITPPTRFPNPPAPPSEGGYVIRSPPMPPAPKRRLITPAPAPAELEYYESYEGYEQGERPAAPEYADYTYYPDEGYEAMPRQPPLRPRVLPNHPRPGAHAQAAFRPPPPHFMTGPRPPRPQPPRPRLRAVPAHGYGSRGVAPVTNPSYYEEDAQGQNPWWEAQRRPRPAAPSRYVPYRKF